MTKFYWFLGHEQFQPEELVVQAKLVESMGFDGVMVSEHLQPWVDDVSASGFAFSTLGAIAASTTKIKLMSGVVTPLFRYHPAIIAQAAATVDRLSGGRFELGIGSGENINEAPLGYRLPNYQERYDRMVEAIEIMRELLSGRSVNHRGKYYQVDDLKLHSPPVSNVPILLAANGPKSAGLAAKLCDGVITSVKNVQDTTENVINSINNAIKNDFRLIATRWSVYANNDDEAWQALQPWRGLRAPNRATLTKPIDLQAEADQLPKESIMGQYNQLRSVSDIIACYETLVTGLKADSVCFQITSVNQMATIKLIGGKVLPHLRNI